ncbi:MAG: sigma-70 family RNA polymerase sigma factor [Pseudomonadota bacterium]
MRLIYERYASGLTRYLEFYLRDGFDAADVVHETMLTVWQTAGRYEAKGQFKAWLYSIARNKAIDRNRKRQRLVHEEPDLEEADDGPGPEDIIASFQATKQVQACLSELSAAHKTAIHLAFYEHLTYQEVADHEGVPLGTIKTRIMHAKKLLLRCLQRSKTGSDTSTVS